jgi:hypothetical protein
MLSYSDMALCLHSYYVNYLMRFFNCTFPSDKLTKRDTMMEMLDNMKGSNKSSAYMHVGRGLDPRLSLARSF